MKNNSNTFILSALGFALLILVGCLIVFFQWFTYDCIWPDCAPHRNFTIYDLNIPDEYFPNDASIKLRPNRGILNAEEAFGSTAWVNGQAKYIVLKFGSKKQASQWFTKQNSQEIFDPALSPPSQYLNIIELTFFIADQYNVLCGYVKQDLQCVFQAQYQEFYIFFTGSLGEDGMSEQDFIGITRYIDGKMNDLLNASSK